MEQSVYGLREQLARAGVEISAAVPRRGPAGRDESSPGPASPITKESFYQLRSNMSLQDAERLLGRAGELNYRMGERDGTTTENYRWKWINPNGSEGGITVSFQNNRLAEKEFWGDND